MKKTVLSIGYADGTGYPVKIVQENMGKVELTPEAISAALTTAANKHENVICHEFYADGEGVFYAVLLCSLG